MKRIILLLMCVTLFLAGCMARFKDEDEQNNDPTGKKVSLPGYQISNEYYYSVLPFEASAARGLVVGNIYSRTDLDEFEMGLMRLSQEAFPTNQYFFQEGQFLTTEIIKSWLARKYTDKQLAEYKMEPEDNLGLNPIGDDKPRYLAHILEQKYFVKEENKMKLGGISIGLALNSVHWKSENEVVPIDQKKVLEEGKKIAQEVLKRLRAMDGLADVPITIALYEQNALGKLIPGNFIAITNVDSGSAKIAGWETLNEKYYLFPSTEVSGVSYAQADLERYNQLKDEVEEFFPNFTGIVGKGFYVNDELQNFNMTIPVQFYGKTEVVSFTQFVAGKVIEIFPKNMNIEVSIKSGSTPEALIIRRVNEEEPMVYIYQQ